MHSFHLSIAPTPQRILPTEIMAYMQRCPLQEWRSLVVIHHHAELALLIPKILNQQLLFATDDFFDPHLQQTPGIWYIPSRYGMQRAFHSCPVDGTYQHWTPFCWIGGGEILNLCSMNDYIHSQNHPPRFLVHQNVDWQYILPPLRIHGKTFQTRSTYRPRFRHHRRHHWHQNTAQHHPARQPCA